MMPGASRAEQRDTERTRRVVNAALHKAGGKRYAAAANLRAEARQALQGATFASMNHAGDERTMQLIETASRRIRAAGMIERGE